MLVLFVTEMTPGKFADLIFIFFKLVFKSVRSPDNQQIFLVEAKIFMNQVFVLTHYNACHCNNTDGDKELKQYQSGPEIVSSCNFAPFGSAIHPGVRRMKNEGQDTGPKLRQ